MQRQAFALAIAPALIGLLACVTINVYFPEKEVKDLSEKIEDAVEEDSVREPASSEDSDEGSSRRGALLQGPPLGGGLLALIAAAPAYADQGEVAAPAITNPAIRRIIESRRARVNELNRFKASGVVGENNRALVEIRDLGSLPLAERAAVQKLVKDENADRQQMFKEIAAATSVDLSQLPQIQETYAETLRQRARRGEWVQMPDGTWKQKT